MILLLEQWHASGSEAIAFLFMTCSVLGDFSRGLYCRTGGGRRAWASATISWGC